MVSIDYVIRLTDGTVVESTAMGDARPLTYLHGRAQIVPGIENALEGVELGAAIDVVLAPEDGFGEHDPDGVFAVPRSAFPPGESVDEGATYSAARPDGRTVLFRVLEAERQVVLIDTNHPLAGQTLQVFVEVREVREATGEELRRGRPDATTEVHAPLPS